MMFKYFAVTITVVTLILSSVMPAQALVSKSLSGVAKEIIDEINNINNAGATTGDPNNPDPYYFPPDTRVFVGDLKVNGRIHAGLGLCVGSGGGNCRTGFSGEFCGFLGAVSGTMGCQGVTLPDCPLGYKYMTIGMSGIVLGIPLFWGTCVHE